jgi:hypothetical protein
MSRKKAEKPSLKRLKNKPSKLVKSQSGRGTQAPGNKLLYKGTKS